MAGIKSLAVRGIRSFGPEEHDEQRILFEKPLTLILGQNGCGKTTIIECLRYAITGQMPPGSRNECFVHDAKVNRSTEVLAQVKLKIVNAKDKQLEVSRSMKVTALAKKKTKFQTLDSFLSIIDENGKTKDISSRCADLDFVMHEELGVSKAILNSVIFCHQEDSSWPLDEGKKVKERFDEIFDADKYSDCFDRLRKIRKEYTQAIKLLEQEVSFLTEKKEELDKRKLAVVNTESSISEAELKVAELTQQLNPISEKLKAIEKLQKDLVMYETKKANAKGRIRLCQSQEEELKNTIKTVFEGTTEELEVEINNYATNTKAKQKEKDECTKKIAALNKEATKNNNERNANDLKINKLKLLESQNQEKIEKKYKMIAETAKLAEIDNFSEVSNEEEAERGIEAIRQKVVALNAALDEQKAAADGQEKAQQALVDGSRDLASRHKQKISSKETEINNMKKEITKLNKALTDATESKQKLEVMEEKLKVADEEYEQTLKELNPEESQNAMEEDEKLMEKYEQDLKEIEEKVIILQKQSAKLKERDMVEESLKNKEKQLSVLKNKHRSALIELLGSMPEKFFAVTVNKAECELRSNVEEIKQKQKDAQIEITTLKADRKHLREALSAARAELTKAEDAVYRACGTQAFQATLAKVTANVDKLQEEQNVLQSSMFVISKYKSQLQDNNCCPLCNRGFDAESEVTDLISQLTTQVMNVPAKLEKVTEELQRSSAKKDELLGMRSLNERLTTLKEQEIPQLEKRMTEVDQKVAALSETVDELAMALMEPEQRLQAAKLLAGDMPLLDRLLQELDAANKQLEVIKSQCPSEAEGLTLEEASSKQAELRASISALRTKIKVARGKINAHGKRLQAMLDKRNKLRDQLLNLQKKVQEIVALQEKMKQLETDKEKFLEELKELQDGIAPLEADLKAKEAAKIETVKKNRNAIDVSRNYITKIVTSFDKVKAIVAEIKKHEERNIHKEIAKISEDNERLEEKKKQIAQDLEEITKKIDSLKDELLKQELYKRDLEDNLKLRNAQRDIEACQKELDDIEESLKGVNADMIEEKGGLISQQTKIFKEKATKEGQLSELRKTLETYKREINLDKNKDIDRRYREKFYELNVTKAIDKDIRDYAVALEKCLMEFHREKMENINLIIREMWRKIYRGNDIDYIEIKTEGGMSVESDRRKYDYRVVQCKNGVEIDMRGRCSAGQKVLACLIIRLALAETFSARFGILALDEPTTNLDQENIRSLCSALGEIVQERMSQKNFMFIIITHDREFIESLGNIDKVTHYYEVSRNDDGKSRIKRIRFT